MIVTSLPVNTFAVGAGASSGMSDYYWQNPGNRIALVGGAFSYGASCGFWCWNLSCDSSLADVSGGCRVLIDNQK